VEKERMPAMETVEDPLQTQQGTTAAILKTIISGVVRCIQTEAVISMRCTTRMVIENWTGLQALVLMIKVLPIS
jgi:hypothetical protein